MQDAEVYARAHALFGKHLWRSGACWHWRRCHTICRRPSEGTSRTVKVNANGVIDVDMGWRVSNECYCSSTATCTAVCPSKASILLVVKGHPVFIRLENDAGLEENRA